MSYFIGLDIGTGSTKALAIDDATKKIIAAEHVSYPTLTPKPYYSEQAPEIIWQAFIKCISRLVRKHGNPKGIGLSSAMHSLIPIDKSGNPLMNMITWADARSADIAESIYHSPDAKKLYEETGMPIHAMSPLCKIIWLRENESALFNTAHKFISIKEYIWFKIFAVFEIDHSIASATGLFNIHTCLWNEPSLQLADISVDKLSVPVSTTHKKKIENNAVMELLGIPTPTEFVIGGSDGCLANLGSSAMFPGRAALTIGTSGAIRIASHTPCPNFGAMTFNYRLDENTFIAGGPINNGGAVWKWFIKNILAKELAQDEDYHEIIQSMSKEPGANGLLFMPYLLGERAPVWNSKTSGVFFGITERHNQSHFTRAVIEGITMALYSVGKAVEDGAGYIEEIYVSGGFTKSPEWLQILADMFNKKIILGQTEDASAIGAAMMAKRSVDKLSEYPAMTSVENVATIIPSADAHKQYQRTFPLFKRLYENLKDDMKIVFEQNTSL